MRQSYTDFEVIMVDNGSVDGSANYVREKYPVVKVIALEKNIGFGSGNNMGINASQAKYVALLNNDTQVDRSWLQELVRGIETDTKIAMCASKMVFADNPSIIDSAGDELFGFGQTFTYRFYPANHSSINTPRLCFYACAGAALYRRSILEETGLFDDIYTPAYYEDCDLGFRAQMLGYECLYVPTAHVAHKVSGTIIRNSRQYTYYYQRNVEFMMIINYPASLYLLFLPVHILYQIGCFFVCLHRGSALSFIKGKLDFFRSLDVALERRSCRRKLRKTSTASLRAKFKRGWFAYKIAQYFQGQFRG
jgi:hypothetical protein